MMSNRQSAQSEHVKDESRSTSFFNDITDMLAETSKKTATMVTEIKDTAIEGAGVIGDN